MMRHFSAQRGFSLIELVVTIAVLGMLLVAILPSVGTWVRNTSVRSTAETIQAGLSKARNEALRRNRVVTFWMMSPGNSGVALGSTCVLSSASASWVVSLDDPSNKCQIDPSSTTEPRIVEVNTHAGAASVTIAAKARDNSTAATSVSFNAYGQQVQTGTPISIIDIGPSDTGTGARNLRVTISPVGGVRLCDRDVPGSDPRACG